MGLNRQWGSFGAAFMLYFAQLGCKIANMGMPTIKPYKDKNQPHLKWRVFFDSGGKRASQKFRTKKEATKFQVEKEVEYENLGKKTAQELGENLKKQAVKAARILQPYGRDLVEAAQFLKKHLEATEKSKQVSRLLNEDFIKAKTAAGNSPRHVDDLRCRVQKFADKYGDLYATEVSPHTVQEFLDQLKVSGLTKNNYRRALGTFFSWCERLGYCSDNPVSKIPKIKTNSGEIGIFTPNEMKKLLKVATTGKFTVNRIEKGKKVIKRIQYADGVLANVLLCGFAGIRQAEFERLQWEQVRLERGKIDLSSNVTKTAARRIVDIQPVLAEWLNEFFPFSTGPVKGFPYQKHMRAFRTGKSTPEWKDNGLRHSFASYLMECKQDPGYVSLQMGHNNSGVVFQHYRELVDQVDAQAYWALNPSVVLGSNVVEFKKKASNDG